MILKSLQAGAVKFIALVILLIIISGDSVVLFCQTRYMPKEVHDGGTVTGKVVLENPPKQIDRLEISQDNKTCGTMVPSPRIITGKSLGVANAIVYLEGISTGKKFSNDKSYLIKQHHCEYSPHVMIVPAGNRLDIVNEDAVLHNVHTYETNGNFKTVFNIAQPVKGIHSSTKPLEHPGLLETKCDAGHPWMSAYIMVADHPYYTVTDKNGNFSLDDIPPGTYTLHMWHEGVAIADKQLEHGKVKSYTFENPYEETRQVTISSQKIITADFTLTLR